MHMRYASIQYPSFIFILIQVLDVDQYYLMAPETLVCHKEGCNMVIDTWMPFVLQQLSDAERSYLCAALNNR